MVLGVDVGGTFTDAVLAGPGLLRTAKAPTTPGDQSEGVMAAVAAVLRDGEEVERFAHGMTVATNALLEGRGARTVLAATAGFTDVVELGRQDRAELYRLCAAHPAPLVPPERRVGVPERLAADGTVLRELDLACVDEVAALDPEAVAVCLLHADRHPEHERALGAALRERLGDGVHVSLSHEAVGTFREHERFATTEVDAALSPLLRRYLRALVGRARDAGLPEPRIMQSSGGLTSAEHAASHAVLTVLSGPAGGAAAAQLVARAAGEPDLVCFDMGGTSCDVCVVQGGRVRETGGREVGGRPLAVPMVDIHTVGAGGGSVAWLDAGGALRVGPRSAGAQPGPASYGRGGTEPTVTDAHAVLGHLPPVISGVRLDVHAAREAVASLGLGVEEGARGILRVADAEMVRAIRVITVERGIDPRGFALLAFGGAGPLHACAIARELEMTTVLVPRASGVLSALGLAAADARQIERRTVMLRGDALTDRALAHDGDVAWEVRYRGQAHELRVDGGTTVAEVRERFEAEHEARYGYREPGLPIEVITRQVTTTTPGPPVALGGDDEPSLVVPEGWRRETDAQGTVRLTWTR
jgi:N-methylhydantoinase A